MAYVIIVGYKLQLGIFVGAVFEKERLNSLKLVGANGLCQHENLSNIAKRLSDLDTQVSVRIMQTTQEYLYATS
jgi:hypothetical protein